MKKLLLILPLLAVACKPDLKFTPDMLIGTWNGVEWKVQGKTAGDRNASSVYFVFEAQGSDAAKGRYIAAYGDQKERGEFKLKGDKLYTTGDEDKIEKVVRVVKLTADTLVLDMNRMGTSEELVLVEKH